MTRCITYSRVSTDAQERDGTSLDTQEQAALDLATERGWEVVQSIRDTASGFSLERPGIEDLRIALRRGEADVVVAYAVDRLSRNQNHIGVLFDEFEQSGARLEFVTERFEDTAVGRFILAARAFVAEVEREKIAERTMRGKEQRARSGRLPQGTGRGMYGYSYDPESGTRDVVRGQAQVVRRIYEDFVGGLSCNRIANDLNSEAVPAFAGGRWYPLTVRRVLLNEAYTGRTVYRRTRVQKVRDAARGRWVQRVTERDEDSWIEVDGATPAVISRALFERAKQRLNDPHRHERARRSLIYPLKGRIRCRACGAAMVGQSLQKGRYRYYRCRRSYAGPRDDRCSSPYIRQPAIETAVRQALTDILGAPGRVLEEARLLAGRNADGRPQSILDAELADVEARQRRLVRLFTSGDVPESILQEESRQLAQRRQQLESERAASERRNPLSESLIRERMPEALAAIREWVERAGDDDFDLLLRALDVQIRASREEVEIRGSVPLVEPLAQADLVTIERTSA